MRSLAFVISLLVAPLATAQAQPELTARAYVSTAGPYGEIWELNLGANGKASLAIRYMRNPSGNLAGEFLVSSELVNALRTAIASERFMELPPRIEPDPVPFHKPDLRLRFTAGDRAHEITVYDPHPFETDARVQLFLTVWKRVFAMVPLAPKW